MAILLTEMEGLLRALHEPEPRLLWNYRIVVDAALSVYEESRRGGRPVAPGAFIPPGFIALTEEGVALEDTAFTNLLASILLYNEFRTLPPGACYHTLQSMAILIQHLKVIRDALRVYPSRAGTGVPAQYPVVLREALRVEREILRGCPSVTLPPGFLAPKPPTPELSHRFLIHLLGAILIEKELAYRRSAS